MIAQAVAALLGVALMAAPRLLGYEGTTAATTHWILGPTIASVGLIALFAVTRGLRWLNLIPAVWLLVAPWIAGYPGVARAVSALAGAALLGFAPLGSPEPGRYGGGWRALLHPEHLPGGRQAQ